MRKRVVIILAFVLLIAVHASAQQVRVKGNRTPLRDQPTPTSTALAFYQMGTRLDVIDVANGWYKVRDPQTKAEGYIMATLVELLPAPAPRVPARPAATAPPPEPKPKLPPAPPITPQTTTSKPEPATPGQRPTPPPTHVAPTTPPSTNTVVKKPVTNPNRRTDRAYLLGRVGYFVGSSEFSDIYGNGPVFGGEFRVPLAPWNRRLVVFFEGAYRTRTGETSFTKESTTASIVTVEGGVLYRLARGRMSPYVGGGVGYHTLTEKSDALGTSNGGGVGFLGTGGLTIAITPHVVLDIRAKYSSAKVEPSPRSPDVTFKVEAGGLTGGIGFGVIF